MASRKSRDDTIGTYKGGLIQSDVRGVRVAHPRDSLPNLRRRVDGEEGLGKEIYNNNRIYSELRS